MKFLSYAACAMALAGLAACNSSDSDGQAAEENFTAYVNPRIGSGGHGHVFVGANVPFGMVQVGPTSIPQTWDWCSGYHESDSTVIGFSHTHMSGTGIGDLFDVTLMPVIGNVTYARGNEEDQNSGMWSYAFRSKEVARPGYYSVPLTRYGINAEMTATPRVGMHRYTFPASDSAAVVIDLQNGGTWDAPVETVMEAVTDSTVVGYRRSKGWAPDQKVWFVAQFSKPFKSFELNGERDMYGRASFDTADGEQVLVKVALSPVSIEGANANLAAELPGWDFDATRAKADKAWNDELGRIRVTTANDSVKEIFYSALYHTMFFPMVNSDVDGAYMGADGKPNKVENGENYTLFSLWDTYRAEMPLMSIMQPERNADMINSMLAISEQQGRLPVWFFWGNETNCMVGNPGIIPVADAVVKGMKGVDPQRALKAIEATAMNPGRGNNFRIEQGFIPSDKMTESIAFDMEYAIADGAAARAYAAVGDTAKARYYTDRSHSYRNYFDPSVGFMRGKLSDGSWRTPFSPYSTEHRADDYCEGNAWQYTFLVPQDVEGLEQLFGGREQLLTKLDSLFTVPSQLEGKDSSPDISGLIGQYAHGNEPVHHVIYMYPMLGQPAKAAERVREVLSTLYSAQPDGLSGNEDAGQMSAWYVLSSLGFYEAVPASGEYWFGSPVFDKAEIAVPGGTFTITTTDNSDQNIYIQSMTLDGEPYTLPYITYNDIMKGGDLVIQMGATPAPAK